MPDKAHDVSHSLSVTTADPHAVKEAASWLEARLAGRKKPVMGLILGSGLGAFAQALPGALRVSYADIPHFLPARVEGHASELVFAEHHGCPIVVMSGRIHHYEGHSLAQVTLPVRVLAKLGIRKLVVTNAAGGLNADFGPGDLMVITDHINLTGANPLRGPSHPDLGPRFVDMSQAYSPLGQSAWHRAAEGIGLPRLRQGIYLGVAGPSYETPAEVRMMQRLGGDAVGMSTVGEVIVARQLGLEVAGLSVITNAGAGLSAAPLSHAEVTLVAQQVRDKLRELLLLFVTTWS